MNMRLAFATLIAGASMVLCGCISIIGKPSANRTQTFLFGDDIGTTTAPTGAKMPQKTVVVLPVDLPDYMERPQIVTRGPNDKLIIHELNQWAEPLEDTCTRIIANRIAYKMPSALVVSAPYYDQIQPDLFLKIQIGDFIAKERDVCLRGRCEFWTPKGDKPVNVEFFNEHLELKLKEKERGIPQIVAAMNQLLIKLSDTLATETDQIGVTYFWNTDLSRNIVIQANRTVYITVDNGTTGQRVLSKRMERNERLEVPYMDNLKISASNPKAVFVNGEVLEDCPRFKKDGK